MSREADQGRDEIVLREASLADARRELEAGELSIERFADIEVRETTAIQRVRESLVELAQHQAVVPVRIRSKRWIVVASICFALAIGVVLWSAVSPRQAGNSITGSVKLGRAQQIQQYLTEAESDIANGNVLSALSAYQQVFALDANDVQALTQTGWLVFSAGGASRNASLTTLGVKYLRRAISLAPRQPAPRLYYAIVAYSTPGNQAVATTQFRLFLASKPSAQQLQIAAPFLKKLGLAS